MKRGYIPTEDYNGNNGVTARINGLSLKWDYVSPRLKGFYFGPQSDISQLNMRPKESEESSKKVYQASFGIRLGYRLMFGTQKGDFKRLLHQRTSSDKGFYLNLWAAYIYNPTAKLHKLGTQSFEIPKHVFFPTIHLGWKF